MVGMSRYGEGGYQPERRSGPERPRPDHSGIKLPQGTGTVTAAPPPEPQAAARARAEPRETAGDPAARRPDGLPVGTPFQAGQPSANPGGRPSLKELRQHIRTYGKQLVVSLAATALDRSHPKKVEAAKVLLAYGYGMPNQPISGPTDDEGNGGPLQIDLAELKEDLLRIAGQTAAGAQAADPDPEPGEDTPPPDATPLADDSSSFAASEEAEKGEGSE